MKTGTISRLEGNAIVIGKDPLFIGDVDVSSVKCYDDVEYENVGPNLKSIGKKIVAVTPELKKGSGIVTKIDPSAPFFEYEFSWSDKTTGERKSAKSHFTMFSDQARKEITSLKEGDKIQCQYEVSGKNKTLTQVGLKTNNGYTPKKTLTIGGTINLENYENLKIEISGPFNSMEDAKKLKEELLEVALLFGGNQLAKELIGKYVKRVCGGQ